VRVLIVDDSDSSRSAVEAMLAGQSGLSVVGHARDGEEALRAVLRQAPDVVVLDLQMPRMDGFTFLRLVMAQRPTPVVVLSAQSRRSDVFKALELGALDFVPKPEGGDLAAIREVLLEKCQTLGQLRAWNARGALAAPREAAAARPVVEPGRVAVLGASTGGPQAIQRLLSALAADVPLAVLVAQHMPEKFTATFAERISRTTSFSAQEAEDGDVVAVGRVLVAPGGHHLELARDGLGVLRAAVRPQPPGERGRYCPSADLLFLSAARLLGRRACAVVLTGMGNDGQVGIREVHASGGLTLAESEASAVVYGMPLAAVETGAVDEVLALDDLAPRLARFARAE
jgi:two-component system chemotaxis response regulator CheB